MPPANLTVMTPAPPERSTTVAARPLFPLTFDDFEGCTVTATDPTWATGTCLEAYPCRHVREAVCELLPRLEPAALEAEARRCWQEQRDAELQLADDADAFDAGLVDAAVVNAAREAVEDATKAAAVARGNVRLHQLRRRAQRIGTPEELQAWDAEAGRVLREFGAVA